MESNKQTNNRTYLASLPNTERLFASHMAISSCGKFIAYCSKYLIIIRNLENPHEGTRIFEGHQKETSAVAFSSNGFLVASGDVEGNMKIWNLETMHVTKEKKVFSSKITGMDFVDNNKRLFIYGYGKG